MIEAVYTWLAIFGISEFIILFFKKSDKQKRRKGKDQYSLALIWLMVGLGIIAAILVLEIQGPQLRSEILSFLGLGLAIFGSLLRWLAIRQLSGRFTVDVSIIEDHLLITNGLYRYLRHPSYTGLLITLLGAGLAMQNSWSLALLTIPFLIAITYRIKLEESLLLDEFGPAYEAYMKTTKRLIPLVFLAILMVEAHGIKTHCLTKKNTGMQQTASRIPNHYPPS